MTQTQQTVSITDALKICLELYNSKQFDKCEKISQQILKKDSNNVDAKYFLALALFQRNDFEVCNALINDCIKLYPENMDLCFFLARIKKELGLVKDAIYYYEKAISINPSHVPSINNVAVLYNEIGNNDKALSYYNLLKNNGIKKAFVYNNISLIYKRVGMIKDSLYNALKAIEIDPDCFEAHQNAALSYIQLAKNKPAIEHFEKAIELCPDNLDIHEDLHELCKKSCDWKKRKVIGRKMDNLRKNLGKKYIDAEHADYKNDEQVERFIEASRAHTNKLVKSALDNFPKFTFENRKKDKNKSILNIGYISSDIKEHPVAHLMRGVFKNHNKDKVKTFLYSFSPQDNSEYPKQIKEYVDNFIDINALSNYETAKRIYNDEIDILIDLNGHTGVTKLEALALKPAPIQVNYLGYIGSMGADFIDYVITDNIVTPPQDQKYYDEKFVYMPDCYQANDNDLEISEEEITRESEGLPEDKLIFCSLNQTYKFEPVMFEVWMNILKKVPKSVLWLYKGSIFKDDNLAMENLKKEAKEKGVDPSRLIFAEPMTPISKHLKRTSLADIALDTRLYNGGTVTSQTLWAGVPVITIQGKVFQSRMASSILNAIGLKDMVTSSLKEYEELAVKLATNKEKLKEVKSRLEKNKHSKPLYNTELFTSNLEKAYREMWYSYCDGKPVNQIDLSQQQESFLF
jgi:protein O-GlcNAc transferase